MFLFVLFLSKIYYHLHKKILKLNHILINISISILFIYGNLTESIIGSQHQSVCVCVSFVDQLFFIHVHSKNWCHNFSSNFLFLHVYFNGKKAAK